ncbi:MAG: HAD hydrolase family protein [Campylobacterales bacterium]|nr:HAD hydrolase family protein [Campylobacterales bacterium]
MSIELIVLDVDGTMTDGSITYSENGDEIKSFNVKDGLAINSWVKMGRKAAIITGRFSNVAKKRADELGIEHFFHGVDNKHETLLKLLNSLGLSYENVAIIGDDFNDVSMIQHAKLSFAPNDAVDFIKNLVDVKLKKNGGKGAVREMIEYLLKHEDIEDEFLQLWC